MLESEKEKPENKKKHNRVLKLVIVCLVIIILCLLMFFSCGSGGIKGEKNAPVGEILQGEITSLTPEELRARMKELQDEAKFTIQCSSAGTIEKDSKVFNIAVANPLENMFDCYIDLLTLDGKVLYTSPTMKPDSRLESFELKETLPEGEGKLLVRYVMLQGDTEIGSTEVEVSYICK